MSPDKERAVSVMSIGDKKETGILKMRIAYFDKDFVQTDLKLIETEEKDINNNIESFTCLDNGDVIVLVNKYKNRTTVKIDKYDKWGDTKRTPVLYHVSKDGKVKSLELETEAFSNQRLINDTKDVYFYVARDKEKFHIRKIEGDFKEVYKEPYDGPTTESSNLKIHEAENKLFFVFENWFYNTKTIYNSIKERWETKVYKDYGSFNCLIIDKGEGEAIYNLFHSSAGGVSSGIIDNELYCGYRQSDKKTILMKISNESISYNYIIPSMKFGKRDLSPFFLYTFRQIVL